MNEIDYEGIKYRRQYILTDAEIACPFIYFSVKLQNGFVLYVHKDLIFCESSYKKQRLLLLGDIYSWEHPEYDNQRILKDLNSMSFQDQIERISKLAGRFVIVFEDESGIKIFHDTSSARKVFFIRTNKIKACSSNQHLLAKIFGIKPSNDKSKLEYYSSDDFKSNFSSNILDTTYYDEILQLLPNHYLDTNTFESKRYWPRLKINNLSKEEIIRKSAEMIRGFLIAASKRYKLMIPVTSGYDSRIILAASREVRNNVFYYLNDSEHVQSSPDGEIAKRMLADQNLYLNLLQINQVNDEEYTKVYYQNNPHANREYESIIYNYLIHFPDSINLPGSTIPLIKSTYDAACRKITAEKLAKIRGFAKYPFAVKAYSDWLSDVEEICENTETNICDLLYWEDRNCNGSFQIQLDKDIAQEDLAIFNSAYLISLMLSYDINLRKKPYLELHKEIIKYLWPELLAYPFNPSLKQKIIDFLIKLQIYSPIIKLKKTFFG